MLESRTWKRNPPSARTAIALTAANLARRLGKRSARRSRNMSASAARCRRRRRSSASGNGPIRASLERCSCGASKAATEALLEAADVEHDRLQVGHVEHRVAAADPPPAAARPARAAERLVRLPVVGRVVDDDVPDAEVVDV